MDNKINNNELTDVIFKPNKFGGFVFFGSMSIFFMTFFFVYFVFVEINSIILLIILAFFPALFIYMTLKFFAEREVQ